jgi:hypothetical protein
MARNAATPEARADTRRRLDSARSIGVPRFDWLAHELAQRVDTAQPYEPLTGNSTHH